MIGANILNYTIEGRIAGGGMAEVYKARHNRLGTLVAVKILNPLLTADAQIRQRFENEAKVMAGLNHPNITRVLDFEEKPDRLSIVMEYLEGEDLNAYIKRKGALKLPEAQDLFFQILDGFQYAHQQGVVHRDVKPSNIFIQKNGQVKILDFGIAKLLAEGSELTQTGTQMGTPIYMSPEQVHADKSIDPRSDIYSLGVTLYYMLSGEPPYDSTSNSNFDIFTKIVREPVPPLKGQPILNALIQKATEKDRNQRFQSCAELRTAWNGPAPAADLQQTHIQQAAPPKPKPQATTPTPSPKTSVVPPTPAATPPKKKKTNALWVLLAVLGLAVVGTTVYYLYSENASLEADFKRYMEDGTTYMEALNWDGATTAYSRAGVLKPEAREPKAQLAKIDSIQDARTKFLDNLNGKLKSAQQELESGNLETARTTAKNALKTPIASDGDPYNRYIYQIPEQTHQAIKDLMNTCDQKIKEADSPAGKAKAKVLGTHPLTCQWISWNYTGLIKIWEEDGQIKALGEQSGKGKYSSDFLKVEGTIEIIDEFQFRLTGTVDLRVYHINDGKTCRRKGTFLFRSTQGRQYWRMSEMRSPCDVTTDYVDIYFEQK